jgi:hypothetical protein
MEEENLRLQAEKQRLLARLALYTARQDEADTGTYPPSVLLQSPPPHANERLLCYLFVNN